MASRWKHAVPKKNITRDNKCMTEFAHQEKRLTFSGVNDHNKNGISDRMIMYELPRAMMIHEKKIWSTTIPTNLCPHALNMPA